MQVAPQEACQPVLRDLPDELWAMVLQFLMKVDVKSARLVCKRFDSLAIPLLYDVVIVAPHRKDLAVFDAIAGHKVYNKYVKELVYSAAEFGDYDLEVYEDELRVQVYEEDESHLITEAVIAEGYATHKRYAIEQREVLEDHEDFAHLCMNLRNLERLQTITILEDWNELLTEEESYSLYLRSVLDPLPRSHGFVQRHWNPLHLEPRNAYSNDMKQALMTVLRALSITHTGVKHIYQCQSIPQSLFTTTVVSEATLRGAAYAFQHLETLGVTFDCGGRSAGIRNFAKILSAAARLQALLFSFYIPFNAPCTGTIGVVFGYQTWLHLSTLNLRFFSFGFAELQDFLRRHAETLRLMALFGCDLHGGSWINVLDFLRSDLRLSKCDIRKVRDADGKEVPDHLLNWKKLNEYLRHGGKNPLREA